jgi:hypothetical protein
VFLTDDELRELTGWRRRSRQVKWLTDQGVPFYLRRDGRPVVVRSALSAAPADPERDGPNLAVARRSA